MRYRHAFHAGNFADVHKHVTLLALLQALKRKDKPFLYLETHAGRGSYALSPGGESASGLARLKLTDRNAPELQHYAARIGQHREAQKEPNAYPGSPLLALQELRPQDRAVLIEQSVPEMRALEKSVASGRREGSPRVTIEQGDGFARLRAWLPPAERRALTLVDPPYERTQSDFEQAGLALGEGLRRFPTGVMAVWYPIKLERETARWLASWRQSLAAPVLMSELWVYPRDARVALNGSGMLIANPPFGLAERMQLWLPELLELLRSRPNSGGSRVEVYNRAHG